MSVEYGPCHDAVAAFLTRVAELTPDEALALTRRAPGMEPAGRSRAVRRAERALARLGAPLTRDVHAGVWAAFLTAREDAAWRAAWDRVFAIADDPWRRAEAAGAILATTWDAERVLEATAAAIAVGDGLSAADRALVLAPWLETIEPMAAVEGAA